MRKSVFHLPLAIGMGLVLIQTLTGCHTSTSSAPPPPEYYVRTNLVSNLSGYVDSAGAVSRTDANLLNPWGLAYSPTGPFWVADNLAGGATVYDGSGNAVSSGVFVPPPTGSTATSTPTGIAYNGTSDFNITANNVTATALYIVATQDGTISGWSPTISGTQTTITVDRSKSNASYTGVAIGSSNNANFLFAANFEGAVVDIFDNKFNYVSSFTDTTVPAGYAPYNIVNISGRLIVAFAKQDSTKKTPVAGAGLGYVDIFDTTGKLLQRLIAGGHLNAPWGLAQAPSTWGKYRNRLLVGNNGDGHINAYAIDSGSYQGTVLDGKSTNPVSIPGLRALIFGNGATAGSTNALYLTADINAGQGGLFSVISYTTLH